MMKDLGASRIGATVFTHIFIIVMLWNAEWQRKTYFASKLRLKQSKLDYQSLINNFPEGILIKEVLPTDDILFINKQLSGFLKI